jgi:programmed cell death 6-interacting protein
MLAFNVKQTTQAPVSKVLSPFVDPQKWKAGASFVQELDAWREKVRQLRYSVQGPERCRDGALHYYKLVTHAAHHFRGVNLATEAKLAFRWHDTFNPKLSVAHPEWRYERAAVLFNLAASLSYLATLQDRGDPEGMKLACKYFQEAAGAIAEVRSVSKEGAWVDYTPDMTNDFLRALEALMLAQAQKCFYEKAVADGRPHALIAKIAAECAALYAEAWLKLDSPVLQQAIVRQPSPQATCALQQAIVRQPQHPRAARTTALLSCNRPSCANPAPCELRARNAVRAFHPLVLPHRPHAPRAILATPHTVVQVYRSFHSTTWSIPVTVSNSLPVLPCCSAGGGMAGCGGLEPKAVRRRPKLLRSLASPRRQRVRDAGGASHPRREQVRGGCESVPQGVAGAAGSV